MYSIGDVVVYGTHGICEITGIENRSVDGKRVEYFVLAPKDASGAKFFVPTHNPSALAKLRKLLTAPELEALLRSDRVREDTWIQDENRRKQYYRELIGSGDRAAIVSMVGSLQRHRQNQAKAGRKFHLCDENFLRDAEKLLGAEFSLVLGIPLDQVGAYVEAAMGKENE